MLLAAFSALTAVTSLASASLQPNAALGIPNADFSVAANEGTIGGGALGATGAAPIGSGPWNGTYAGILSLLAPPTLTIGGGQAQIGGLAGVNVAGILNNEGRIRQDTGIAWQPNRRYVLQADVDVGGVIGAGVLTAGNAGLALATGNDKVSRVASSTAGTATLTLLSGTTYRVSLEHVTGASVSGNIFAHLFAEPTGLLTVDLFSTVAFDNVALDTFLLNQVPASIVPATPGPYTGTVGGAVSPPIGVVVLDALGDPISGVEVSFQVPASGPSATVVPNPAITDTNGVAHVTTTANTIAGDYQIIATVAGVPTPIVYDMTNLAGPPSQLGNATGSGQDAEAGETFSAPFGLQVSDEYGNPVAGVEVTFIAPSTGASSSFDPNPAISDANGVAQSTATANTIAGTYQVEASVSGVSPSIFFDLTNTAGPAASIGSLGGSGQGAVTGTAFATPLGLQVLDQYGNAVDGIAVSFVAPAIGASASITPATLDSGVDGFVSVAATANSLAGNYLVDVSVAGLGQVGQIELTNLLDPSIGPTGVAEPNQNASIGTPFACVLLVQVSDGAGDPIAGLIVDFVAPQSGPSALLVNGAASGSSLSIATDDDGFAWVEAVANGIVGTYTVGAQLRYSLAAAVEFNLRNLAPNDPIFANGFDGSCIAPLGQLELDTRDR